jgi:hypothetical protein
MFRLIHHDAYYYTSGSMLSTGRSLTLLAPKRYSERRGRKGTGRDRGGGSPTGFKPRRTSQSQRRSLLFSPWQPRRYPGRRRRIDIALFTPLAQSPKRPLRSCCTLSNVYRFEHTVVEHAVMLLTPFRTPSSLA